MTSDVGRWLIWIGLGVVLVGLYLRLGGPIPPLGHLPGDIVIRRGGLVVYLPITTMILVSLLLTLALRLLGRGP